MRSEYVIVDGCNELKDESLIYLVFAHSSLSDLKIFVDTVRNLIRIFNLCLCRRPMTNIFRDFLDIIF